MQIRRSQLNSSVIDLVKSHGETTLIVDKISLLVFAQTDNVYHIIVNVISKLDMRLPPCQQARQRALLINQDVEGGSQLNCHLACCCLACNTTLDSEKP